MPLRNRISLEQRERIVRAFEDVHEQYLAIAETIGVNRSTARDIVSRYAREGRIAERPRDGANHVRVDDLIWSNLTIMAHIMGLGNQSESWKIVILS